MALTLVLISLFGIVADAGVIEATNHPIDSTQFESIIATDANVDISNSPTCPVGGENHPCHLGHHCQCVSLVSDLPSLLPQARKFHIPAYRFNESVGFTSGIIRPPIFA